MFEILIKSKIMKDVNNHLKHFSEFKADVFAGVAAGEGLDKRRPAVKVPVPVYKVYCKGHVGVLGAGGPDVRGEGDRLQVTC